MRRIRVGVIGCGEAAQLLHLPALVQLADRFEVTAVCDVSPTVLAGVGDLWGVRRRLSDYRELATLDGIDAVVIANPDPWHGDAALAAIAAGKLPESLSELRLRASRGSADEAPGEPP